VRSSLSERKPQETPMNHSTPTADEQRELWNGTSGQAWVEAQQPLDDLFRPFEQLMVATATGHSRVLDVGCGTGSTTLAIARHLGTTGQCVGVDISEPMLSLARARAERANSAATFICANAENHVFEPESFDLLVSRFGVMFFADPVRAFTNLLRGMRSGGEMLAIAWRGAADNPFMTTAERAAAPLLTNLPARKADGPGQFAFADRGRVQHILQASGWADIDIRPIDVPCVLPEQELTRYFTQLGPVGSILRSADEDTRARVINTVRAAFDPYVHGSEVRFTAACWSIGARAP
jgi:SAM-dependent methyltransferase